MKVRIGNSWFRTPKVLKTDKERQMGYQYLEIDDIDETNNCLLFVFDDEQNNRQFHMRNCDSFDIKLYALNADKKLVDSFVMQKGSNETYKIHGPCKYVVEVPAVPDE